MQDLTLPTARTERDQLAARTDVLDKVGVLRTIPDDMHLTTPMVAEFYEIDVDVVRQLVSRNRAELDSDGFMTVTRADVSDKLSLTWSELGFPAKSHTAALFTRRAVLRVGMLLRDSDVARRVRDMLLDVEHADAAVRFQIPQTMPEALRLAADEYERAEHEKAARIEAEQRARALEAPASAWSHMAAAAGDYAVGDAAKILSRDPNISIGRDRLFAFMAAEGWIYRAGRRNSWTAYQTQVDCGRLVEKMAKPFLNERTGETELPAPTIRISAKGLAELHRRLGGDASGPIHLAVTA